MLIRPETPSDALPIRSLTDAAFGSAEHSSGTEAAIIEALRAKGALTISLVAEEDGRIVGHVAFSRVLIAGNDLGWFGLAPVSVSPDRQRCGIGTALIEKGLKLLEQHGAKGCVVLGDPNYYRRFGFTNDHHLSYAGVSPEYFQSMTLSGNAAKGDVSYDEEFEAR